MPPKNSGHIPKSHKTTQTPELSPKKTITGNPRNHWVLDRGYAQKPCVGGRLSPPCPSLSPPFTSTLVQLPCIAFTQLSGKTQGQKAARASLLHSSHCRVWDFKVCSEKQAARESSGEPNCGTPSVGMLWGMRWERSKGFGPIPSGHQRFPCLQSVFSLSEGRSSMLAVDKSMWAMLPAPIPPQGIGHPKKSSAPPQRQTSSGF